jgi:vacuole morphology and inheritance protein 14
MVQTLNIIMLTSSEFYSLRAKLRNLNQAPDHRDLFIALYRYSWQPLFILWLQLNVSLYFLYSVIGRYIHSPTFHRSWSHNPAATLSLCLLSQQYQHASDLVYRLCASLESRLSVLLLMVLSSCELEITVNFLIEIDKLIQLIESPIFTCTAPLPFFMSPRY